MTDEKTTKELMKALIEFLRAKTESKTDNEFTKRIMLDEVEITYTEEQSWPEEFKEEWVEPMVSNNLCLSCHQEHDSGYAFCKVCLPWCLKEKDGSGITPAP